MSEPPKVLFVTDKIGILEVMSIPLLSAAAKKTGARVRLIEFGADEAQSLRVSEEYRPDIVAYSVCSNEIERYMNVNALIKKKTNCMSVFGGPHPTFFPEMISDTGVDAICRGEGDLVFPRFLESFHSEEMFRTNNFSFKMPDGSIRENPLTELVPDLDTLPFADRDLVYSQNYFLKHSPIKSFFAGRGCPFNCTYCFNQAYHTLYKGKGRILRSKSVRYLVEEIKSVSAKYPLKFVKFQDDVFGANLTWLEEFSETYPKEIGLPFLCYARPNMVNEAYACLLKSSGCYSVCMAFESGNEHIRRSVLNRKMTDLQIVEACRHLRNQHIRIYAVNMVGLPGETEAEIIQTLELNRKAKVDFADASIFQPYPGTSITKHCEEVGLLDENHERYESQFSCSVLNFDPDFKMRIETIHRLFSLIVDYPVVQKIYPVLAHTRFLKSVLNLVYRTYYGIYLHKRIYAGAIPLTLRLRGMLPLLFSRNRI